METIGDYKNENRPYRHDHQHSGNNRIVIGVILVLAGFFLVIRNTGFFPGFIDHVIFSWPMLLVVIGLVITLGASEKTAGLIIMAVGGFFLIPTIFGETFHIYNMFWPAIFIIIGVILIVSKRKGWDSFTSRGASGNDYIDFVNIFGGGDRRIVSENFKGGKVTCIFGGMELDLTKARLAPGKNEVEIACIFGGATIIVPDNWFVTIEVTPILGGFTDSRKPIPGKTVDQTSQLVLRGAVIFGGGEIKSY